MNIRHLFDKKNIFKLIILIEILILSILAIITFFKWKNKTTVSTDILLWQSNYVNYDFDRGAWHIDSDDVDAESVTEGDIDFLYGPYLQLPKGDYKLTVIYNTDRDRDYYVHSFENDNYIDSTEYEKISHIWEAEEMSTKERFDTYFSLAEDLDNIEIRMLYDGQGFFDVYDIAISTSIYKYKNLLILLFLFFLIADGLGYYFVNKEKPGDSESNIDKTKYARHCFYMAIIMFVLFFVLAIISYRQFFLESATDRSDIFVHSRCAADLDKNIFSKNMYPLWDMLIYIVKILIPIPLEFCTAFVMGSLECLIFYLVEKELRRRGCIFPEWIAFGLCVLSAIYWPWYNRDIYLGQGSPNQWQNPTNIMVKPLAIMIVLMCERIIREKEYSKKDIVLLGTLFLLSVLAKPSFAQGFVPAIGISALIWWMLDGFKKFSWYFWLLVSFVPGGLFVILQYFSNFTIDPFSSSNSVGVELAWLDVLRNTTPNVWISLILVLAFPTLYLVLNFKKVCRDKTMIMYVLFGICSWLEYALFAETGERKYHCNFGWAFQLFEFIIFLITTRELFYEWNYIYDDNVVEKVKKYALLTTWLLHLSSGIIYLYQLIVIGVWA